ncbi:hypothetical protein AWB69_02866 [Caballeronia udeis]|uniref:Uncharacterized protein n=1 Tax=Caballeronia udeis TaxID=1232866 RepID=A0A158GKU8_9BURK|nr:hypothetical protein AWB69_02866 [Caballeronia udeis]
MLFASRVFCQRDAARIICITRISRLEKNVSMFPSYTIATALAALKPDPGQNVLEVVPGVATKGRATIRTTSYIRNTTRS